MINLSNLKTAIAKNWKTTTIGIVLSGSGYVSFSPHLFGGDSAPIVTACKYISCGGLAALGVSSKDFNVVGK